MWSELLGGFIDGSSSPALAAWSEDGWRRDLLQLFLYCCNCYLHPRRRDVKRVKADSDLGIGVFSSTHCAQRNNRGGRNRIAFFFFFFSIDISKLKLFFCDYKCWWTEKDLRCFHAERSTAPSFVGGWAPVLSPASRCLPSRVVCLEQNGPIRGRCPGLAELGGWGLRPRPKPRWSGRLHRWHLPSLQADQSAACTHHGPVQPHPGQGELFHRQQVSLHLWRGQRGQEVRQENHGMAISFFDSAANHAGKL